MSLEQYETPIGMAMFGLGLKPYPWQEDALMPLMEADQRRVNIAVKAPNAAGKDTVIIPAAAYWWNTVHERGTVVVTSGSAGQLDGQTIPQLEKHKEKFGFTSRMTPRYESVNQNGARIIAFVTDKDTRAEGWHKGGKGEQLLIIINEAKGVPDALLTAFLARCTPNAVLMLSSPGEMKGLFYKAFSEQKSLWVTVSAGLMDCPHVDKDRIAYVIAANGEDNPITRSTLYGEFMEQDEVEQYILSASTLDFCLSNPPQHHPGFRAAFCDFGGGDAENTIAFRNGNKIELAACWKDHNKFAAVARFIQHFRKLNLKPEQVWGDAADKEMLDFLSEAGWKIHRQACGGPPRNEIYLSWIAEAWLELAIGIGKCEWILPRDDKLIEQGTSRKRAFGRAGRLGIEDKHTMKKRNVRSPDRWDAVAGVTALRDNTAMIRQYKKIIEQTRPDNDQLQQHETLSKIGANAGW